jgi:hypothetical protein
MSVYTVHHLRVHNKSYPFKRKGKDNPSWKGGKRILKGYVLVKSPAHPYRDSRNYVAEHRLVMEQHIGRYLKRDEVVHHKNGITTDNRIENLELLGSAAEHRRLHLKLANRS